MTAQRNLRNLVIVAGVIILLLSLGVMISFAQEDGTPGFGPFGHGHGDGDGDHMGMMGGMMGMTGDHMGMMNGEFDPAQMATMHAQMMATYGNQLDPELRAQCNRHFAEMVSSAAQEGAANENRGK